MRLNPTIWGPRVQVQTVFSHKSRAASAKPSGAEPHHQIRAQFGKTKWNVVR
jgi:hypothetical protein